MNTPEKKGGRTSVLVTVLLLGLSLCFCWFCHAQCWLNFFTVQLDLRSQCMLYLFKRFYLFIFRERGREREREGMKHQCVVASHAPPTGWGPELACNPGMCRDQESNCPPFGSQAGAQTTEPHQPACFINIIVLSLSQTYIR